MQNVWYSCRSRSDLLPGCCTEQWCDITGSIYVWPPHLCWLRRLQLQYLGLTKGRESGCVVWPWQQGELHWSTRRWHVCLHGLMGQLLEDLELSRTLRQDEMRMNMRMRMRKKGWVNVEREDEKWSISKQQRISHTKHAMVHLYVWDFWKTAFH